MSVTKQLAIMPIDNFVAPPCIEQIDILYQDSDLLLINKPSGLLSLSGKNPLNLDSVHYRLVQGHLKEKVAFMEAKLIHRLDFGTSGIMVVGLNALSIKHLNQQFQARGVQKSYLAMLEGWVEADQGEIKAPIANDKMLFPRVKICHNSGKKAHSRFKVLKRLEAPKRTLVKFTPQTGRTHQLRIHSQVIGHPILGCDLYHSETSRKKASRLLLHANEIRFKHPTTRLDMQLTSPCAFSEY